MLWQPQHLAGESCDLVCCLRVCSWNQMINWDSWLLCKNNPFLVWERKWKWEQPHVWKAPKWVDHRYVAALVNLMDFLPVLWYLESHLLGLKHVGMAALVHSNLKSLLSEGGLQPFRQAWEKGLFWELPAKLPDGAIRKLLHKGVTVGKLFPFSGNSFAQIREEETKS